MKKLFIKLSALALMVPISHLYTAQQPSIEQEKIIAENISNEVSRQWLKLLQELQKLNMSIEANERLLYDKRLKDQADEAQNFLEFEIKDTQLKQTKLEIEKKLDLVRKDLLNALENVNNLKKSF